MFEFKRPVRVSSLSTTYVRCEISATENGVASNPTSGTISFAFISESTNNNSNPASGDWKTASWESASGQYWGRCLVGSGGAITLTAGNYDVWVRVIKTPETVVQRVGVLTIY